MYKMLIGIPVAGNELIIDKKFEDTDDVWCDFELDYYPYENYYKFEFETMLAFKGENGCRDWIIQCLADLTDYMNSHNYDISKEIDMYDAFTIGYNVSTHFDTIEDAYAWLKMMVFGFHGQGLGRV